MTADALHRPAFSTALWNGRSMAEDEAQGPRVNPFPLHRSDLLFYAARRLTGNRNSPSTATGLKRRDRAAVG